MSKQPLIQMTGIWKRFGTIQALRDASFEANAGEIHVILGENGAGKSSLMNVLVGLYQPAQGAVFIEGKPAEIRTPADAVRLGVAMVPQHVELIAKLTVWENVILGREGAGLFVDRKRARAEVGRLIRQYNLGLNPERIVGGLSAGQQQKVEILKMLYRHARILILDEPTTFLTPQETDALYETLVRLGGEGLAVLVVTHKLRDALRFSRRITTMRGGRVVAHVETADATEQQLVQWLMGADAESSRRMMDVPPLHPVAADAPALLELADVSGGGGRDRVGLQGVRLRIRRGEVHGIAGITGSGQRELSEAILGLTQVRSGSIRLGGREVAGWTVEQRLRAGLFIIPEDRVYDGILPGMTLYENLVLGQQRELFARFRYDADKARAMAAAAIDEYEIKAPNAFVPVNYLSGGNMQKVIVARAVNHARTHDPAVIIAVNPTRGLDVRTVRQVHDRLLEIASGGGAVLLMSEDLDELIGSSHVISVIHQGKLVDRFEGPGYDRYAIGSAMLGREEVRG
jgi:general nucleoside transport system ATP-binding protein